MDQQKEIIAQIAQHLAVTPADIDLHASLSEDLGLGPIELADLLGALSEHFNVTFEKEEVDRLRTVSDIVELVEDLRLEE